MNGPSHESAPVYAPVIRSLEGTDATTAIVTEHIGVGAASLPEATLPKPMNARRGLLMGLRRGAGSHGTPSPA